MIKNIFFISIDPKRIFGLDILRALAILFVVIGHGNFLLPSKLSAITNFFVYDGVAIFFVLSGFLIGGILINLINKNGISIDVLWNFWKRRWFRTLPNYFFILLILCSLNLIFTENFSIESTSSYFIFSQNLISQHPLFFPEAWSLSIEEWFYLLVPIIIALFSLILKKDYKKSILYTSLFIIISITSFRYYRYFTTSIDTILSMDFIFRKQVITRLDSLMFGVIGAYVMFYYHQFWINYRKSFFLLGIILFILIKFLIPEYTHFNDLFTTVFSFTLTSIATLALLPFLTEIKGGEGLFYKPITYISLISYSMYLLNLSIIQVWIIKKIPWNNLFNNYYLMVFSKYGLYWALVISLSILLYKYFEVPMTSLRENKIKNRKM